MRCVLAEDVVVVVVVVAAVELLPIPVLSQPVTTSAAKAIGAIPYFSFKGFSIPRLGRGLSAPQNTSAKHTSLHAELTIQVPDLRELLLLSQMITARSQRFTVNVWHFDIYLIYQIAT